MLSFPITWFTGKCNLKDPFEYFCRFFFFPFSTNRTHVFDFLSAFNQAIDKAPLNAFLKSNAFLARIQNRCLVRMLDCFGSKTILTTKQGLILAKTLQHLILRQGCKPSYKNRKHFSYYYHKDMDHVNDIDKILKKDFYFALNFLDTRINDLKEVEELILKGIGKNQKGRMMLVNKINKIYAGDTINSLDKYNSCKKLRGYHARMYAQVKIKHNNISTTMCLLSFVVKRWVETCNI